jgi:phosphoribosylformimino-5-aminoimidazole carboxamide ribotide isomerase
MRFRPCIDLHNGHVKQIVGATLSDEGLPTTNFETDKPAADFARLYRSDGLSGGHIAMLGEGNESAAIEALEAYPKGLQIGGGINDINAPVWIQRGAQRVIVTSFIFEEGQLVHDKLHQVADAVGRENLVFDLSCAWNDGNYVVMSDRWQRATNLRIDGTALKHLAEHCSEFLIHAVDKEGLSDGIDKNLVELLGRESPLPTTYAGGISSYTDIEAIEALGKGRIDYTVGSALDIFGGTNLIYADLATRTAG